jgi:hypothetical protein
MLEQQSRKCVELWGEYVELIHFFSSVACRLLYKAKDLSAPPRSDRRTKWIQSHPTPRKKIKTLVDTNSLSWQDHFTTQQPTSTRGSLRRCSSASPLGTPNQTSWWPRRVKELLNHLWGVSRSGAMSTALVSSSFGGNVSETDIYIYIYIYIYVSRPHLLTSSFSEKEIAHGSSLFFFLRENYLEIQNTNRLRWIPSSVL